MKPERETVFSHKLREAGLNAPRLTMAQFVWDTLRETGGDQIQTARRLEHEIAKREGWLAELCQSYVAERAKDQSGDALRREKDGGQRMFADSSQNRSAPTPPAEPTPERVERGHGEHAEQGHPGPAPLPRPDVAPAAKGDDGGQTSAANDGQMRTAPASPPATGSRFKPGHARRGGTVIQRVQQTMRRSCMDTYTIRDGRVIGDVSYRELPSIEAKNLQEAHVLRKVREHMANAGPSQRVRDIVTDSTLERYIDEAKEMADAA